MRKINKLLSDKSLQYLRGATDYQFKDRISKVVGDCIDQINEFFRVLSTVKDGEPGKDGRPGMDGKNGKDGVDGKDGQDGNTPYIKDDYWYIDGINTGIKAKGSSSWNDIKDKPNIPTENTISDWGFTKNTGNYNKPGTGIPATDLESAVQTSLDKANTALQIQVQVDWNETDDTKPSFINNKPTIPNVSNFVEKSQTSGLLRNDGTVDTNNYLVNAPVTSVNGQTGAVSLNIPAAQVNSDWDASSGVAAILNKPTIPDVSNLAEKVVVVDASTLPSTLDPNKVYQMGTLTGNVTIPAFSAVASGDNEAKIWCFTFNTSTTAPTITWSAAIIDWVGGSAPTINASKKYEVTVMDGVGAIMEA